MTQPVDPKLSGLGAPQRVDPKRPQQSEPATTQGPAFRALLEKLEAHAKELAESTRSVGDPEQLAGAVGRAKETLEEALGVGDHILEAYRQALHQRGEEEQK
jgi:hypothetical protein